MPRSRRKSQTPIAIYARQWRVKTREKNRFNDLLSDYVQLKHDKIYDEVYLFYKSLDKKHPAARNLIKTATYKEWKKQLLRQEESSESESEQQTDDRGEHFDARTDLPNEASDRGEHFDARIDLPNEASDGGEHFDARIDLPNEASDEGEHFDARIDLPNEASDGGEHFDARIDLPNEASDGGEPDILSAVVDEVFSGDITSVNETLSVNEADNIIQEIINDLEQDEALRGILNQVNDINEFVQPHY